MNRCDSTLGAVPMDHAFELAVERRSSTTRAGCRSPMAGSQRPSARGFRARQRIASWGLALLLAAMQTHARAPEPRAVAIQAHTRFLAHDLLQGRDPGTDGYDIAAQYVAAQFALAGLTPAPGATDYFQQVPMRRRELVERGAQLTLTGPNGARALENGRDFAIDASPVDEQEVLEAGMVFVGWGIDAPHLGFHDYDGVDVRGKAVVLLEGAPATLPGALRAHYSWIRTKEEVAASRGAVAVITIKTPEREKYASWERTRTYKPLTAMSWLHPDGTASNPVAATMTFGPALAQAVFAEQGADLKAILARCEEGSVAGFALPHRMRLARQSTHAAVDSANVVGMIAGRDPALAREYVVVLAHLDHVGLGPEEAGDRIHNGAVDNAGGVAVMLEAARAIAAGQRPRRSVLFVATTAEEKGLLGAEFFARHLPVPASDIVAAISVDGLMAFHDFATIVALGDVHSTLGHISAEAARSIGARHVPDPIPGRGNLALSDQYPMLRLGIPVLFPNPGRGETRDGRFDAAAWDEYEERHYHKPGDEIDLPIDWSVAERWALYIQRVVRGTAEARRRPAWYEGDVLGETFSPGSPRALRP
ncbi:M28 family metallopeptidase [Lysobacter soli]|uniref:M28 family metallopeptidase n=1 Tax=Lysobacter soli TaxID=453783 RepID=UPI0024109AA3|nr:M28 family metallopeptidase [Lysobacter soli]MDG2517150.1 M28 family metallopeptidase [Lysobacter soli]